MKRLITTVAALALFGLSLITSSVRAQDYNVQDNDPANYDGDYYDRGSIDRYLDAEVWTDHADADYYTGDEVVIHFRVNRDAFVAIYSIDSRGMVNLLFPADPAQDNYVLGGMTYALPGPDDDYDLVLNGPEGTENIQIIASRERFPIPDWYHNSGLVHEGDDVSDYMDWLNGRYFVRYSGQRFAYDRAVLFVNEWEPSYFRPVYYPDYPSWAVVGNIYVDYPWGSTVYINGYYWGVTPLYIPRILVGWHTLTIYDRYGYCWENDFHVSRYHTVVFDRTVVAPSPSIRSKFTRVQSVGYRDPVTNGYKNYDKVVTTMKSKTVTTTTGSRGTTVTKGTASARNTDDNYASGSKHYVRGETKLVKTDRGYETGSSAFDKNTDFDSYDSYKASRSKSRSNGSSDGYSSNGSRSGKTTEKSSRYSGESSTGTSGSSTSGDYYKRKSGSSSTSGSSTKTYRSKAKSSTGSSGPTSKSPTVTKSKTHEPKSTGKSSTSKVSKESSRSTSSTSKTSSSKSSTSKSSSSSSSSSKGKTKR